MIGLLGNDILDGGNGIDWIDYHYSAAGVTVSLVTNTATFASGEVDTLISIERVCGSNFSDNILGHAS